MSHADRSRADAEAGVTRSADAIQAATELHQQGHLDSATVVRELAMLHLVTGLIAAVVYVGDAIRESRYDL